MGAISLEDVSKTYHGAARAAVSGLTLDVPEGSIVALIGPSGCGKTTILRLIAGFERPDEGRVALAGRVVSDAQTWLGPEKRGVGMVFQDPTLFPHLSVHENVGFNYQGQDRKERVAQLLELVGLAGYEARQPHQLSGGQQQRVALARALARKPVVVLLDEPFSNLDAGLRDQMRLEMRRIFRQAGTTAVFVTHDQREALAIADAVAVMREGRIVQYGSPREVYESPGSLFVAEFLRLANMVPGVVGGCGGVVQTEYGTFPCAGGCRHTPGAAVKVSIPPDRWTLDHAGTVEGRVSDLVYAGDKVEVTVDMNPSGGGDGRSLLVRLDASDTPELGGLVRMRAIQKAVPVVGSEAA